MGSLGYREFPRLDGRGEAGTGLLPSSPYLGHKPEMADWGKK